VKAFETEAIRLRRLLT